MKKQVSGENYECKYLQWDTDYFGINSARVNLHGIVKEQAQNDIIEFCKEYDFVTISNIENIKENNYWIGTKTNAFLVDINVQFMKVLKGKSTYQSDNTYVVNNLPGNKQIIDIAKKTFFHSRFFNDPKLSETQAQNIYLYWTKCAFGQPNKHFVVCERGGNIVGYILFSLNEDISIIELIAVDEKYQRQGIGKLLIQTMESFVIGQGTYKIKVGTQVNNAFAIQFYSGSGFTYVGCRSIYHLWRA